MTGKFSQPNLGSKFENKADKMNVTSKGTNVWASVHIGAASPGKSGKDQPSFAQFQSLITPRSQVYSKKGGAHSSDVSSLPTGAISITLAAMREKREKERKETFLATEHSQFRTS